MQQLNMFVVDLVDAVVAAEEARHSHVLDDHVDGEARVLLQSGEVTGDVVGLAIVDEQRDGAP